MDGEKNFLPSSYQLSRISTALATGDEDTGTSMNPLRELMTGGAVPPYFVNFQEPLASPVVSWEILRKDGPPYQSMQIRFYDT